MRMGGVWGLAVWASVVLVVGGASRSNVEALEEAATKEMKEEEEAVVFKVGGDEGWHEPAEINFTLYTDWAERNRFRVGDSLNFQYNNDSVQVVDKWSYYHCNTSNPIAAFDNGNSTFTLNKPGPFYFISGTPGHCRNGQRLLVNVMSPHSPPSVIAYPPQADGAHTSPSPSSLSSALDPSPIIIMTTMMGPIFLVVAAFYL